MRIEYDFLKAKKNPFAKRLKKQAVGEDCPDANIIAYMCITLPASKETTRKHQEVVEGTQSYSVTKVLEVIAV